MRKVHLLPLLLSPAWEIISLWHYKRTPTTLPASCQVLVLLSLFQKIYNKKSHAPKKNQKLKEQSTSALWQIKKDKIRNLLDVNSCVWPGHSGSQTTSNSLQSAKRKAFVSQSLKSWCRGLNGTMESASYLFLTYARRPLGGFKKRRRRQIPL